MNEIFFKKKEEKYCLSVVSFFLSLGSVLEFSFGLQFFSSIQYEANDTDIVVLFQTSSS